MPSNTVSSAELKYIVIVEFVVHLKWRYVWVKDRVLVMLVVLFNIPEGVLLNIIRCRCFRDV